MDQSLKVYWSLLIINVILTSIAIALAIYFISSPHSLFTAGDAWLFVLPLIFFLLNSLYILFFIRDKYPVKNISNKIEGFAYVFAVLTFFSASFILFTNSVIVSNVINDESNKHRPIIFYVSIPAGAAMILSLMLTIYSFKVLKAIRKNLEKLAQQIKNIGTEKEPGVTIRIDS